MSRKPKKGYFVRGQFVAEGSEMDLQLKAELKGTPDASRTDLKRESDELQDLGKDLLGLRSDLFDAVGLPEKLVDAIAEAKRITNFEGKRRQMQYVGKLMRKLDPAQVAAARQALDEQHKGSATEKLQLHLAEQWRDRLIADEAALTTWLEHFPSTDIQALRSLIRQARKDEAQTAPENEAPAKKSRAYRDLFQLLRNSLRTPTANEQEANDA